MSVDYPKQRGIYSEKISPEVAQEITSNLKLGPDSDIVVQTNAKIRGPKAMSLQKKQGDGVRKRVVDGYYSKGKDGVAFVEPKVTEPYEPIPGRVPRKVAIDRKRKEFASISIEDELTKRGIDFNTPPGQESWLSLELFDDKTYDDYTPEEWIEKGRGPDGVLRALPAKALHKGLDDIYVWRDFYVHGYDKETDKFVGRWATDGDNGREVKVPRLHLLFDAEDPRKFADRVANAFQERIYADSIIRYNYYIDNMPTQDLNELDSEQRKRLEILTTNTKKLREAKIDLTPLLMEVNNDYARTMNRIIFDKYHEECSTELLPANLRLPPKEEEQEAPLYGMIQLPHNKESKDFTEIFKDFCFNSLYIKEEVIKALQEMKEECNHCLEKKLFQLEFNTSVRIEDFKHQQDSATSSVLHHLKVEWVGALAKIIEKKFEGVGKGWFNMKETNKTTYDFGKLKKFLTLARQMMQDVLLTLTKRSYYEYCEAIEDFMPDKVEIFAPNNVKNTYTNIKKLPSGKDKEKFPLFNVDLIKDATKDEFKYSTDPKTFVKTILDIFDKTLTELAKINDLEQLILKDLANPQKKESYIKAPVKPREQPTVHPHHDRYRKVTDENKWVWDLYHKLKDMMEKAIAPLEEYLKVYEPYKQILHINADQYVRDIEAEDPPRTEEALREEIHKYMKLEQELKESIPEEVHVSCFSINTKDLIAILAGRYSSLQKNLTDLIAKRAREKNQSLMNDFNQMERRIRKVPQNIKELTELQEFLDNIPNELDKIKIEIDASMDIFKILETFNYRFPVDDMNKKWNIYGYPKQIKELVEERRVALEKEKAKFQEKMLVDQEEFKENIENLERTIQGFYQHNKLEAHEETAGIAESVDASLKSFFEQAKTFNHHESLFKLEPNDYSRIGQMQKEFQHYYNLWTYAHKWFVYSQQWMNCEWEELNAEEAEKFVEDAIRILASAIRFFRDRGERDQNFMLIQKIAEKVKAEIDEFKPKVPLMVALRKKGMTDRHWEAISNICGFKVKPDEKFTFATALEMGLMNNVDKIVEIGEKANKEFGIETMLEKMLSEWEKINFTLLPFRGTSIIKGYDEIGAVLDEHMVNTQAMTFSPFKGPFEQRIEEWNKRLLNMSNILEEWAKCQGQYMYLQPIFDSPDIAKQLPLESKKFKSVDSTWKYTISLVAANKNVLKVCSTDGLLEKLMEANKSLEVIQKELNNYLEKKRESFARFYFLSNDELLEILSETKEPTKVQPHLRKVFENIHSIEFDDKKIIHAMFSGEGEKVKFVKPVDPNSKNVEFWMGDVEEMMKISVRNVLLNSINAYPTTPRTEWVVQHPGQCVLNGSQVHWTSEVEEAIRTGQVKEYFQKCQDQISDLVKLIRTKLGKMQSITINALIVIDVHAKDVVGKLVEANIHDIGAFEWISQLRYYWENDDCYVKCIQTSFPYGYEYLGNTLRLVITPLTDKCYMTLMGALKLNLGGAPAGPAGTGKTESTKDLAKALAKQCVVFNCSEGMDYTFVGKFFKGLASAGAWACFDEFNRINIEVLSVIAQQLLQLFGAKAAGEKQVEFEGSNIKLNPTFSVFITMNPGYAGRTELPDNLKALFRSVAMMVPDYALIGEIMLYSFGFDTARDLARKMVATFKLSSEQLSSQDHYDYGMRAVRSVINAAGLLKRANPDMNEEQLLLRALRDVNVPKFLKDDLPLFENIITDLFPNVERPKYTYGDLTDAINDSCAALNLQNVPPFVAKILQLYDTIQVRHGLMIVGPTGGGKTSNYKVLQHAMTSLAKAGKGNYTKVHTHILNPKSITMGQLYGWINEQTKEWTDGILAYIVRETVKDTSGDLHWVMFDGPVDALWIESMNTVLDDNKKLCLNSGQILMLTPYMTMMFEVEDLAVASPATVSRCGMVYMEPVSLGIQPLVDSWLQQLPESMKKRKATFIVTLRDLFSKYLESSCEFMKKNCKEIVTSQVNALAQNLMKLMDCYFEPYKETEYKKVSAEDLDNLESNLEPLFIFSLVWSVGCTVDLEGRRKFNHYLRDQMAKFSSKWQFPSEGMIYDYRFNQKEKVYQLWSDQNKNFEIDPKLSYGEIVVPTNDYTRMLYLMKLLLTNKKHVMCPGPTGTGKTLNAYTLLQSGLSEEYQYISITFSAQTGANQTQDTIDSKMEKRRKGVYGPPTGKKCIIFVDDLNMPKKETYGAQPPIEILRQYLDHSGWYDRKKLEWQKLEDLILLTCLGPPGGGRTYITNRIVRHFNMITYADLDENTISYIFGTITEFFLKKFSDPVREAREAIVNSVLHIFNTVKAELRPTPNKSFYTFNLRDISKVFQGICSASIKHCYEKEHIVRLWYHENMRVFHDRLTTEEDREFFKKLLRDQFAEFGLTAEQVINKERIIFGDFMQGRDVEPKFYIQVEDMNSLLSRMENYLEDYNADSFGGGKKQMKLVMFLDACEHIARICRVLRQPQGNALLLGVGGSGRQSLARLATFISGYKLFQVEVVKGYNMNKWRDDLKRCLMLAGVEDKPVSFLFVDTQIIKEEMLEDINNILNTGDVNGIPYNQEDLKAIDDTCRAECNRKGIQPNKMNIYAQYLARIKKNIHCIIAMSPLGEVFRTRLRMFPSLINCCTIDWFTEWPEEALIGVGKGALEDVAQELGIEQMTDKLVEMFKRIHKSVEKVSVRFVQELRRYNYVTPTSYLEQLNLFKIILGEKRVELKNQIERLKNGLDKLKEANEAVQQMQIDLKELQPQLEQAEREATAMMESLAIEKKDAEETQKIVARDEKIAMEQQAQAEDMKRQAQEAVADAQRILDKTTEEIKSLKKDHLVEIKSFKSPPSPVLWTLAGVIVMLGEKPPLKPRADNPEKKEEDYFGYAKEKLLANPDAFLARLLEFAMSDQKNRIAPEIITKFEAKIKDEKDFQEESVKKANLATKYLWSWVNAMYTYHNVYTKTKPLRDKLAETEKLLAEKTEELIKKKEELALINAKILKLQEEYEKIILEKQRLTDKKAECEMKLDRAHKLTSLLSDEKERWIHEIGVLSQRGSLLPGDSTISAGMVAYSGPFTSTFRQELEASWMTYLDEIGILRTPNMNMRAFLGDSVKIQSWNIAGLPKDDTSTENGIIIDKARRWPLMIDPQTQANKFIKNLGKDHPEGLDALKASDPNLVRTIELAVHFGKWVLIENVGIELDPALDPIITQQVVKQGGSYAITIGDKTIPYNENFKLFMTTTNPNPHYPPETFVKVTIINFAITRQGLEEQMLAIIVALENPQLEQKKNDIVRKNAQDKRDLRKIEDEILQSLSESKGDILMDEKLIGQLTHSKKMSKEINERVEVSKQTELQIDAARESYRPVAYRASILFFCITDLSVIDPMYQYSLQWFINLFTLGVENAPASNELPVRLENLNNYFTYSLYENICRSLFEKHKLLFSLLLTVKILQGDNKMDDDEWRYLLTGFMGEAQIPPNPTSWVPDNSWPGMYRQFYGMDLLPKLAGIKDAILTNPDQFRPIYDAVEAHQQPLPEPWNSKLDEFEKMIVLKALRPDKLIPAIQDWVTLKIGRQFVEPPTFDLGQCFKDATVTTPLIFVLSPGSDPIADFKRFADEMGFGKRYDQISLGQGQGPKAEKMIKEFSRSGGWVILMNCHLASSWMPELEKIVESLGEDLHKDFRLWLTSMPTPAFPISVLQNGIKMTLEPPTGLRSNLLRTYNTIDDKELNDCKKPDVFKKLFFGFALFHAIVQDRRKFGPIGWNIAYEFTNEDLYVCKKQLKLFLDEYNEIPYKVINFLGAEINYGGRVTDDKDVRLIKTILKTYINPDVLRDGHKFSESGVYYSIPAGDQADYINYIKTLPLNPAPEAFGLHENAEITTSEGASRTLLETILSTQAQASSKGGKSAEEVIIDIADGISKRTPPVFDFDAIYKKYPTEYTESMNTVLVMEIIRYNRLLEVMASSLVQVKKGLKGEIVLSEELELMARSLSQNQVPEIWKEKSFLSEKPLSSWIEDLNKRINFLNEWIEKGTPKVFWISGFFFPQAFITGMMQNYARKEVIAIDRLGFEFRIIDDKTYQDITEKPEDGCYVYGMFLEGARWDSRRHVLAPSRPKELYTDIPLIHIVPQADRIPPKEGIYNCPIYKVLSRRGTLSTTGHSTNFVMFMELPSKDPEDVWIKAGVAGFLALSY